MRRTVCGIMVLACMGLVGATAYGEDVDNPVYKAWASHKVGTKVTMKTTADFGGNANESTSTQQLMAITPEKVTLETTRTGGFGGGGGGGAPPATSMDVPAKIDKAQIGVAPNAFGRGGGGRNGRRGGGAGAPGGAATPPPAPPAPPAPTDMKTGTEKVDVMGKSEDATTYEYSMAMNFGGRRGGGAAPADGAAPAAAPTTKVKTWMVTDVPGAFVKTETKGSFGQGDFTSTSTISKVEEGNGTATPAPAPAAQ